MESPEGLLSSIFSDKLDSARIFLFFGKVTFSTEQDHAIIDDDLHSNENSTFGDDCRQQSESL
jgi:hypothetical protein